MFWNRFQGLGLFAHVTRVAACGTWNDLVLGPQQQSLVESLHFSQALIGRREQALELWGLRKTMDGN
jgi:hypothetical protein